MSTIALIERLKQLSSPEAEILSDGYRVDEFVKAGVDAATELTTLLQRCEKAESKVGGLEARNEMLLERLISKSDDKRAKLVAALEPFAKAADGRKSDDLSGAVCFSQVLLRAARNAMGEPE